MHTSTLYSWHTTLLFLAMEVFVYCQDIQKTETADQTTVPPFTDISDSNYVYFSFDFRHLSLQLLVSNPNYRYLPREIKISSVQITDCNENYRYVLLYGPECYFCKDNENCSMPLENLDSVICPIGSICAFINVTAEFPGSGSSADIARGCAPDTFGVDMCISSAEYIEDILIPKVPEVKDTVLSNSGAACFCSEDFCNAEIPEGISCYTCDGEDECSQPSILLIVETCPLNSVCGIVNITADLGVPEPVKDVKKGCFSAIPATGCMTSDEYVQIATAHDVNITDVIISTEGMACFCDKDFCNTEIEEEATEPSVRETSSVASTSQPEISPLGKDLNAVAPLENKATFAPT
ncbi:hypothetical protein HOLleu_23433 [Holothuria leucospilota]|uniref:Uncharacterized protein n=1 Tax=Holothuria leucospilota TaxID=206669 RepID=A0A9Q1H4R8_HOLLE|nr:hypothetical protein HOLleu_23433 [Holothuria leucospilota]